MMRLRALTLSTTMLLALGGCTEFQDARQQEKAYYDRDRCVGSKHD